MFFATNLEDLFSKLLAQTECEEQRHCLVAKSMVGCRQA